MPTNSLPNTWLVVTINTSNKASSNVCLTATKDS